jgi:shikimate kinase
VRRHLVLVGLPGSGKSTVGRIVAERLGAAFVDIDAVVSRRMQMPIARIFGEFGESRFRTLEREAMAATLAGEPSVITPGGGWASQPGALESARPQGFLVFLHAGVATAASRVLDGEERPLLTGENPQERMRRLLLEREPFYRRADAQVDNDPPRTPEQAAEEIVALARARAGW